MAKTSQDKTKMAKAMVKTSQETSQGKTKMERQGQARISWRLGRSSKARGMAIPRWWI